MEYDRKNPFAKEDQAAIDVLERNREDLKEYYPDVWLAVRWLMDYRKPEILQVYSEGKCFKCPKCESQLIWPYRFCQHCGKHLRKIPNGTGGRWKEKMEARKNGGIKQDD